MRAAVGASVTRADVVLLDHVDRLAFASRIAPVARIGTLFLVHDFPYEASEAAWTDTLAQRGFARVLDDVQHVCTSQLAAFQKVSGEVTSEIETG